MVFDSEEVFRIIRTRVVSRGDQAINWQDDGEL